MAGSHPHDALGRVLPHPWWPLERQAPGELEFVRRFCNSTNHENGAERFDTPAALDRWLVEEGAAPVAADPSQLERLIDLRRALLRVVMLNSTGTHDAGAWRALHETVSDVELGIDRHGDRLQLAPRGGGVEMLAGRLLLAVLDAQRAGSWPRLKSCLQCRWVVFDPSKNRSSRWCSMSACGGRHNARQYRRRRSAL
jgi:predicted RNA-binding Zn ribbon-like protein